jgi:drug/metabolite transporter (DMT)-like permease
MKESLSAPKDKSYLILFIGVMAISTAAILIRKCDAPALVIAVYRLGIASLILMPMEMVRRKVPLRWSNLKWCFLSGFFLATHFALWISSLSYTSVASSVVLVTTNPLFVATFSVILLKEKVSKTTLFGILLGITGATIIGWGDFQAGYDPLLGDLLALGGALAASAYLLTGRVARRSLTTQTYVAWTYSAATLFILIATQVTGLPFFAFDSQTLGYLLLMALIPQLIGHTSINWSLAHLSATTVSIAILGEPIGASLLAWLILGEIPTTTIYAGSAFILVGIIISLKND